MAIPGTPSMEQIYDCPANTVLICVDGSSNALEAFQYFTSNFRQSDSNVIIFHASDQVKIPAFVPGGGVGFMPESLMAAYDEIELHNKRLKEKYEKLCSDIGLNHQVIIDEDIKKGPGVAIINAAKKNNAKLIVIGTRGLGTIRRTILGSVSHYVLHHSSVPVLICPGA
ncbi:universal stress protein YxiE-like [Styela clava]